MDDNNENLKEILRKVTFEVMQNFDSRIKVLASHIAEQDANHMALVTLLADKGLITYDKFDKRKEEIMNKFKNDYKDLVSDFEKHKMEDGVQ